MSVLFLITIGAAAAAGILGALFVSKFRSLQVIGEAKGQGQAIRRAADKHAVSKVNLEKTRSERTMILEQEELEQELEDRQASAANTEQDFAMREKYHSERQSRIDKLTNKKDELEKRSLKAKDKVKGIYDQYDAQRKQYLDKLAGISGMNLDSVKDNLKEKLIEDRSHSILKFNKAEAEKTERNAKKIAKRMISRTLVKYKPNFYWPKAINSVPLSSREFYDKLFENPFLEDIKTITETEAQLSEINESHQNPTLYLKLNGGMGIKREAARLVLGRMFKERKIDTKRFEAMYHKEFERLDQMALKMGRKAVIDLKIDGIHQELQRMIGHLNWRTSYRQNQYLHTFEVAKLAGMLAEEIGVDPEAAKRCGLLHDIGKGIDYRIEGGHAVISGEYADRYGEDQVICDTVMSHHNELIIETPMAYVLKTADTWSGARPGARVNLEEGYQIRLSGINESVRSFKGTGKIEIMHGGREVHVDVDHNKVKESDLEQLAKDIARKIEENVAFPGQIKVLLNLSLIHI